MIDNELKATIVAIASSYEANEYSLFEAEYGWKDWMNDFTEAEEGEPCSEAEIERINVILQECFDEAHQEDEDDEQIAFSSSDSGEYGVYDFVLFF